MEPRWTIMATVVVAVLFFVLHLDTTKPLVGAAELKKIPRSGRMENFFAIIKQASSQGFSYFSDLAVSIPFTKIFLAGGALLSLFFIFLRLLVVLGPILILGAMTRESTDATDFIKMLIEFYNQVVVALDDQMSHQDQAHPPS